MCATIFTYDESCSIGDGKMTDVGFLVAFFIIIFLVIIFALIAVIGAVTGSIAGIVDEEDVEE